jgi:hypothetical protein
MGVNHIVDTTTEVRWGVAAERSPTGCALVPGVAAEQSYQLIGVTTSTRLAKSCGVIGLRCRGTSAHA